MRLNYRITKHLIVATAFALALASVFAAPTAATIINVPADQATIQAGIDASVNGDTVLVAPGTYYENINFRGRGIVLTSHFMYDKDPAFIFSTVINGSQPANPDTASCVRFHTFEDSTSILQGFTLTGGKGTIWDDEHGAGTYREGGGILCQASDPTIQFNYITNNEAVTTGPGIASAGGGALRAGDGNPHIYNNVITYNKGRYGAGIVLNYCGADIRNNVIAYNTGGQDFGGSGIWKYGVGGTATVINNTIVYNTSVVNGGGIYNWSATMTIRNNIIRGNTGNPGPQISNGGTLTASYCNIEGGFGTGTNITDVDPMFYGDFFYLPDGSPSVDAGSPTFFEEDQPDPSNALQGWWPSRGTLTNDLGAYGGPGAYPFELLTFGADTTLGWAPIDVQFSAACRFPVSSWDWDFGDGQMGSGPSPLHTFTLGNTYDVTLSVDTGGAVIDLVHPSYIVALADSLAAPDTIGPKNATVVIPITARNILPLTQLIIPVQIRGNVGMTFDSFSTVGCRTDYFEIQQRINSDNANRRYTIKLVASAAGTSPDLAPGEGPVLNLFFNVAWNVPSEYQDTLSLEGYSSYLPTFTSPLATYSPRVLSGSYSAYCCSHRGNVDGVLGPGGPVDIADVTRMVGYLFGVGALPPCDDEANVDGVLGGGGPADIADLTYLVAYLLQGGPPPPSCP